jgi:hypothetical protein
VVVNSVPKVSSELQKLNLMSLGFICLLSHIRCNVQLTRAGGPAIPKGSFVCLCGFNNQCAPRKSFMKEILEALCHIPN